MAWTTRRKDRTNLVPSLHLKAYVISSWSPLCMLCICMFCFAFCMFEHSYGSSTLMCSLDVRCKLCEPHFLAHGYLSVLSVIAGWVHQRASCWELCCKKHLKRSLLSSSAICSFTGSSSWRHKHTVGYTTLHTPFQLVQHMRMISQAKDKLLLLIISFTVPARHCWWSFIFFDFATFESPVVYLRLSDYLCFHLQYFYGVCWGNHFLSLSFYNEIYDKVPWSHCCHEVWWQILSSCAPRHHPETKWPSYINNVQVYSCS